MEKKEIKVEICYIKDGRVVCVVDDSHEEDLNQVKSISMMTKKKYEERGEQVG